MECLALISARLQLPGVRKLVQNARNAERVINNAVSNEKRLPWTDFATPALILVALFLTVDFVRRRDPISALAWLCWCGYSLVLRLTHPPEIFMRLGIVVVVILMVTAWVVDMRRREMEKELSRDSQEISTTNPSGETVNRD